MSLSLILSLILFLAGLGLILWAYIRTGKASHKLPHDLSNPNRPTPSRGRYADIYDHVVTVWDRDIGAEVPIGSTPKPLRGERGSHACPIARGGGRDHDA